MSEMELIIGLMPLKVVTHKKEWVPERKKI
jgi:hypothetical protein